MKCRCTRGDKGHDNPAMTPERVGALREAEQRAADIAPAFERKVRAVRAHASQFGKHPDVEAFLCGLAMRAGQAFGVTVAESFKRLIP